MGNGKPFNGEGSKSSRQASIEQASQAAYDKAQKAIEEGHGPSLKEVLKMIKTLMNQKKTIYFQKDGKVTDQRTVLCLSSRAIGVRYGMEIHNLTGRLKLDIQGSLEHKVEAEITTRDRKRLKNAIKRFKENDSGPGDSGDSQ